MAFKKNEAIVYFGYNRPFSKGIQWLKKHFDQEKQKNEPFSVSCFVSGHRIPADHWYKNNDEGTRICGNLGHWIDLAIHFFFWRDRLPSSLDIKITYSDSEDPSDNIAIGISTSMGDIVQLMLTSRSEPFEGVSENINFQYGTLISRIDDFRQMTIWRRAEKLYRRFQPKDVGHGRAILQPFHQPRRPVEEVEVSTALMLHIAKMVNERKTTKTLKFSHLYA